MDHRRVTTVPRGSYSLHRFVVTGAFLAASVFARPSADELGNRFATAMADLQSSALTATSSRRVRAELASIAATDPAVTESLVALYLLGRLRQLEDGVAEPEELARLGSEHPDHPLGQLATLKVLLRRLYADGPESAAHRLKQGEKNGLRITLSALRSDYHLAIGEAYIFYGDRREPALRHLRAAAAIGIPSAATRANVLVQTGELARLTGSMDMAAGSYRAFLDEFPRDLRQQIVRDRLAEVEGTVP